MGDFSDLDLKDFYFPPQDNVTRDFFVPVLKKSESYLRATGFFSSTSLVDMSVGICDLASRGGSIKVITSPRLSQEDVFAIKNGYDMYQALGDSMVRDFEKPEDIESLDRLTLLSELIARGILKIKIAVMRNIDQYPNSIFHPKFGIMSDVCGNKIAFSGSMNETRNAMVANWDMVEVYHSDDAESRRAKVLEDKFDMLWNGRDSAVSVMDMPSVVQDIFDGYRTGELDLDLDERLLKKYDSKKTESVFFKSPEGFEVRPYQEKAIEAWIENGYRGIFDMATGTGKTKTALCALEHLYNAKPDEGIFTIIVAPQKHLVDQWGVEVGNFGVAPIIGHSDATAGSWKDKFRRKVLKGMDVPSNNCLITTISSFSSSEIQLWIPRIKNLAIVVDEAHNMGSTNLLAKLPSNASYRLALSATMDRYKDQSGTESLRRFFGTTCISYSLEDAIGKYLTNYYYYPICCMYNCSEYKMFVSSNEKLDEVLSNPHSSKADKAKAKNDYIEYSYTLNAGMESKFQNLEHLMRGFEGKNHFLIYCGKTKVDSNGDYDEDSHSESIRAIDKTAQIVGMNGIGLKISRITYREAAQDRKRILSEFDAGETDGLIAISCLDEGVDVPSIKTAVIMTSSNNPREYVQRRGRVLRLYPGKEYATIYDMVVLPRGLDDVAPDDCHAGLELKMLAKEIRRMNEFASASLNPECTQALLSKISKAYMISIDELIETYGEDNGEY